MVRVLSAALGILFACSCARGPVPSVSEHRVVLAEGTVYARRAALNTLPRATPRTLDEAEWLLRQARNPGRPRLAAAARAAMGNAPGASAHLVPFCRALLDAGGFEREALAFCRAQGVAEVEPRLKEIEEALRGGTPPAPLREMSDKEAASLRLKAAKVEIRASDWDSAAVLRDLERAEAAARAGDRGGFAAALDGSALAAGLLGGKRLARTALPDWAAAALAARACAGDTLADRTVLGAFDALEKLLAKKERARLADCDDAPLAARARETR